MTGDRHLIYVLLRHLVDNAIKFSKKDVQTVITITSNFQQVTGDANSDKPAKNLLSICVQDNGIGFDQSDSERIFELFYKNHHDRKLRGSGVGLAVARKIMNIHQGFITAESTQNEGSKFSCHFPALPFNDYHR